jgi:ribosomal protein S18 acetylase RimI-like enzyme
MWPAKKPKVKIRPLRADDLDDIMRLHRELGWNPAFRADGSTLRGRLTTLTDVENALLLVAELGDEVAGYIHGEIVTYLLFAGREMLVSELFVREKSRGKGVGSALLTAIEAEAVKRKCFRISVLNSRERESYKRSFYPSLGYEERTQVANFTKRLDWGEASTLMPERPHEE